MVLKGLIVVVIAVGCLYLWRYIDNHYSKKFKELKDSLSETTVDDLSEMAEKNAEDREKILQNADKAQEQINNIKNKLN